MGCFILSAANFWFVRLPFHRPHVGSPPAISAVLTGTALLLVSFFWSHRFFMWLFDVSKEAWNVIGLSFSNVLSQALMRISTAAWKDWVKESRGPALPRGRLNHRLRCPLFFHVRQECGLDNKSPLPQTWRATCQCCRLDTWQNADRQWSDPRRMRRTHPYVVARAAFIPLRGNWGERGGPCCGFPGPGLAPAGHPGRHLALAWEGSKPWPLERNHLKQLRECEYSLCYVVLVSETLRFNFQWEPTASFWHTVMVHVSSEDLMSLDAIQGLLRVQVEWQKKSK